MATRRIHAPSLTPDRSHDFTASVSVLTGVTIVAALYFARDVLIPVALAVLISFVLAPMAHALRRIGVPRVPAVIAVAVLSFGAILGVGALGTTQISQLAENLPEYQQHIRDKIRALRVSTTGNGTVSRASTVIDNIGKEISGSNPPAAGPSPAPQVRDAAPIAVEIRPSDANALKVASEYLMAIFSPVASTFLVILFVIFFLLQQEDLRDRVIKLLGTHELHRTTEAMQDAAAGLSRYFLLQTILNALSGLVIGLGLWAIGVPSPLLWGIFTMLMRFVPYIGSIIAGVVPVALAAAVDPGWSMVISTAALFVVGEGVMGQIIEPFAYGRQTGLSPLAIMIAATFWTWVWGPIGLILATPLTMCLVILGQYTKSLEFLRVLLGDQPALTPPESFYQRLIAGDPAEIVDQAERQLRNVKLIDYYDAVALPGLVLAQLDASSGELSPERQTLLVDGVAELIDGLADHVDSETDPPAARPGNAAGDVRLSVAMVCIGGRGPVDQSAGSLLVQLFGREGLSAEMSDEAGLAGLAAIKAAHQDVPLICVSYVGTARSTQVRFMVRRIRRLFPATQVLVGLWTMPATDPEWALIKDGLGDHPVVTSLKAALEFALGQVPFHAMDLEQRPADTISIPRLSALPPAPLPQGA